MKIDLTRIITDLDGKPMQVLAGFKDNDQSKPILEDATLRRVLVIALWNPLAGDEGLPVETKLKHAELARSINRLEAIDLSADEIVLIKARVNKAFAHAGLVAGAFDMLDPPALSAVN